MPTEANLLHIHVIDVFQNPQKVRLSWRGPALAAWDMNATMDGQFSCSTGRGATSAINCSVESQAEVENSNCTPYGNSFLITGHSAHLRDHPSCRFVSWFVPRRQIAFHSHPAMGDVHLDAPAVEGGPARALSHGCVRLPLDIAELIYTKSVPGHTRVRVYHATTRPDPRGGAVRCDAFPDHVPGGPRPTPPAAPRRR